MSRGTPQALTLLALWILISPTKAFSAEGLTHVVHPGDTWPALIWRYDLSAAEADSLRTHLNRQRQPAIGTLLQIPSTISRSGKLVRSGDGGLLQMAARYQVSPWAIAMQNGLESPYRPPLFAPLFLSGGSTPPRDLPVGFESLELSQDIARPGQALAFRASLVRPISMTAKLDGISFDVFDKGTNAVGLLGTGAFFGAGEPEFNVQAEGAPLWTQPWRFEDQEWTFQQITLTGDAAAIDQQSIAEERIRLFELWSKTTPNPYWTWSFEKPITTFLEVSSRYGARRSYNGGPYRTYHEGVDYAAYGGTAVNAPAAGIVVLAEKLYVRGNAVIIDHGLGVYSGYYHLSRLGVDVGNAVQPGEVIGEVGTTGLSTGNHLHWDLLVARTWVDAEAWLEQDIGCWILIGLGETCQPHD